MSAPPTDDEFAYRENEMKARLNPTQFAQYKALPLADQVVVAHYVSDGHGYPAAVFKLSQLKNK